MSKISTADAAEVDMSSFFYADSVLASLRQALASCDPELTRKCLSSVEDVFRTSDTVTQYKILTEAIQLNCHSICPLLRAALTENSSALVRHEAAFGLGLLGGFSEVELLTKAMLFDDHLMVRHEAAIALAVFCGPESQNALSTAIAADEVSVAESAEFARRELALRIFRNRL